MNRSGPAAQFYPASAMASPTGMTKYWLEAESALPTGWLLYGVVRATRQVDPRIDSGQWCAFARPFRDDAAHRDIPMVEGRGPTAEEALMELGANLKEVAR